MFIFQGIFQNTFIKCFITTKHESYEKGNKFYFLFVIVKHQSYFFWNGMLIDHDIDRKRNKSLGKMEENDVLFLKLHVKVRLI